jgi:hypothetical protein
MFYFNIWFIGFRVFYIPVISDNFKSKKKLFVRFFIMKIIGTYRLTTMQIFRNLYDRIQSQPFLTFWHQSFTFKF